MFLKALMCCIFFISVLPLSGLTKDKDDIQFVPISHATFVIMIGEQTVYVDPVGSAEDYQSVPSPDLILITDIHGDHLSVETINSIKNDNTVIVSPQAVYDKLQEGLVLNNTEKKRIKGMDIEAIPMYNMTEDRLNYHPKGRGNGYLLTIDNHRIYISGDSEDIPEMRELENIDYAFICMNLPYTMTVDQAASAVLDMKPKVVFPYHYRGKGGISDIDKFITLVGENKDIEVRLLNWYK